MEGNGPHQQHPGKRPHEPVIQRVRAAGFAALQNFTGQPVKAMDMIFGGWVK